MMKNVDLAFTRASSTDAAQMSVLNDYIEYHINLCSAHASAKEDSEPEIREILAKARAYHFINKDGQTALHLAAMQNESLTGDVLEHGFDINIRNIDGQTPLMSAVNAENINTVALLLKHHADVNAVNDKQETCLHLAALKDKSGSITELLLSRNADTEMVDDIGMTPLFVAAFNGNDVVSRQLLRKGAKHQAIEPDGFTSLHYAAMQANHAFMSRLLDARGADFEAFYEPSHYNLPTQPFRDTIFKRRALIVRMLIEHGADIHVSSKGFTPLHIAAVTAQELIVTDLLERGASAQGVSVVCAYWGLSFNTVNLLLERGANVEAVDMRWNKPALTWEGEIGSPANIEVLLWHGANVHHQDVQGSLAIHYASANACVESVELLLNSGSNPNMQDLEGKTPLTRLASSVGQFFLAGRWWNATSMDRKKTAIHLFNAGCDPSVRDIYGRVAAHYAASNGHLGILEVIIASGGDLDLLDEHGSTPLERARERGHIDVIRVLRREKLRREMEGEAEQK